MPSGSFGAISAWVLCAAIAHDLLRATGISAGGRHPRARGATLSRRIVAVPARSTARCYRHARTVGGLFGGLYWGIDAQRRGLSRHEWYGTPSHHPLPHAWSVSAQVFPHWNDITSIEVGDFGVGLLRPPPLRERTPLRSRHHHTILDSTETPCNIRLGRRNSNR